jgi:hypothetical protein
MGRRAVKALGWTCKELDKLKALDEKVHWKHKVRIVVGAIAGGIALVVVEESVGAHIGSVAGCFALSMVERIIGGGE